MFRVKSINHVDGKLRRDAIGKVKGKKSSKSSKSSRVPKASNSKSKNKKNIAKEQQTQPKRLATSTISSKSSLMSKGGIATKKSSESRPSWRQSVAESRPGIPETRDATETKKETWRSVVETTRREQSQEPRDTNLVGDRIDAPKNKDNSQRNQTQKAMTVTGTSEATLDTDPSAIEIVAMINDNGNNCTKIIASTSNNRAHQKKAKRNQSTNVLSSTEKVTKENPKKSSKSFFWNRRKSNRKEAKEVIWKAPPKASSSRESGTNERSRSLQGPQQAKREENFLERQSQNNHVKEVKAFQHFDEEKLPEPVLGDIGIGMVKPMESSRATLKPVSVPNQKVMSMTTRG
jgi:hypothetical protein